MDEALQARMRAIPAAQVLYREMGWERPTVWQRDALNLVLEEVREGVRKGEPVPSPDLLEERIRKRAAGLSQPSLRPVINATGVVIHTNLGRSPLPKEVLEAVASVSTGYSTLEYRLSTGTRGSRHDHISGLLTELTGAEAAMVVNNNAAGVLLALSQLAAGHEVLVSRGQLVEIGGSFRIPEVMALSGARLVEVGATNKTHVHDYERAMTPDTRAILKVHTSNFRILGFTQSPDTQALVSLAHEHQLAFMEDLGSGVVDSLTIDGYTEPSVREVIAEGADVVTFSGDKLLGGPQAGIIAGRREWIDAMKKHPLARAIRVDKMTLAGLELVIRLYLEGRQGELPLWEMLSADLSELKARASRLALAIRRQVPKESVVVAVESDFSEVGGGSMPGTRLPTWVVALRSVHGPVRTLEETLRYAKVPVIARIHDDRLILDVRTVFPDQERLLRDEVIQAVKITSEENPGL